MLGLYRIATNLGPSYELKISGFVEQSLNLSSDRMLNVYIDVGKRLTYE